MTGERRLLLETAIDGGPGDPFVRLVVRVWLYPDGTATLEHLVTPRGYVQRIEVPVTIEVVEGKRHAIGNGVPLPMGRAIARAVLRAIGKAAA